MKDSLIRFGVAMESTLVAELDALADARGCNQSELLRDLARAEVGRSALDDRVPAFAAVTLVYNHHVRELSERLTSMQHDLGEQVRSTMHVHLDHEHCLEVVVLRGRSDELKAATGRMIGTRGVIQGGAEYVAEGTLALSHTGRRSAHRGSEHRHEHGDTHGHAHGRAHAHAHAHGHAHTHDHGDTPTKPVRRRVARGKR